MIGAKGKQRHDENILQNTKSVLHMSTGISTGDKRNREWQLVIEAGIQKT